MNQEILNKLKKEKSNLRKNYHITKIGIFGSYVRGEETPESDIDILVEFEKTPSLFKFISIEEYLESILNKKIDLVREQGLKSRLKDRILSEVVYI
jgi:predicted nucleotidyltransferase